MKWWQKICGLNALCMQHTALRLMKESNASRGHLSSDEFSIWICHHIALEGKLAYNTVKCIMRSELMLPSRRRNEFNRFEKHYKNIHSDRSVDTRLSFLTRPSLTPIKDNIWWIKSCQNPAFPYIFLSVIGPWNLSGIYKPKLSWNWFSKLNQSFHINVHTVLEWRSTLIETCKM